MPVGAARAGIFGSGIATPDTSMFSSPIYQWWAGDGIGVSDGNTASSWDDQLSSITANANNSPIYRADESDGNGTIFDAVDYDSADNDAHTLSADSQLPTGDASVSFAALVKTGTTSGNRTITGYGDGAGVSGDGLFLQFRDLNVGMTLRGDTSISGATTIPTNDYITIGGSLTQGGGLEVYLNGSSDGTGSTGTPNLNGANEAHGYRVEKTSEYADAEVAEIIWSTADEPESAFSDYHTDRLA